MEDHPIYSYEIQSVDEYSRFLSRRIERRSREINQELERQAGMHGVASPVYQRLATEGHGAADALVWVLGLVYEVQTSSNALLRESESR
jgi:hypothetical protein